MRSSRNQGGARWQRSRYPADLASVTNKTPSSRGQRALGRFPCASVGELFTPSLHCTVIRLAGGLSAGFTMRDSIGRSPGPGSGHSTKGIRSRHEALALRRPAPVSANAPRQRHPGNPFRWCPAVGCPGRTQPPCGRDRSRCNPPVVVPGHPARLWPSSPQLGARQYPAYAAVVPAEPPSLGRSAHRRKCPADLPLRAPAQPTPPPGSTSPPSRASLADIQPVRDFSTGDVSMRAPVTSRFH
jgi:hypothetical protein